MPLATTLADTRPLDHLILRGKDEAPALLLGDVILTYQDLRERISTLALWLKNTLPEAGSRVASWLPKGEIAALLPLACARAECVYVPINPLLKRMQVAHILADSGAALLIAGEVRSKSLETGDIPPACKLVTDIDLANIRAHADLTNGTLAPSGAKPDALAEILYTSGSTGRPKGVMLSHDNLWLGAASVAQFLELGESDRVLAVLPFAFDYGQNQLLSAWYAGASVAPLDYLVPRDVVKAVAHHHITTLAGVPPLWSQLVDSDWDGDAPPGVAHNNISCCSLVRLTNSGGALSVSLVRRLRAKFPDASLFAMYGLTEAFRSTFLEPALIDQYPTSVGRAIPHAEVLVMRDDGTCADAGEEGEIVHCGPLVALGYWRDDTASAERFRPAPAMSRYGGVAVWSGDRGRYDANGLLAFIGRRDAMIKVAGNRISPQDIEEMALATGLVAEAIALGIEDSRFGHIIHLVVRAAVGQSPADAAEPLSKHMREGLPNFMVPRMIHWRDTLPTGPTGKVNRLALICDINREIITTRKGEPG